MLEPNYENLRKLADRHMKLPEDYEHFDMFDFCSPSVSPKLATRSTILSCGTVACALGHGPSTRGLEAHKGESWFAYCERVFGIEECSPAWLYLFDGRWAHYDNTPHGAARRIYHFIEHGVPAGFKYPSAEFVIPPQSTKELTA